MWEGHRVEGAGPVWAPSTAIGLLTDRKVAGLFHAHSRRHHGFSGISSFSVCLWTIVRYNITFRYKFTEILGLFLQSYGPLKITFFHGETQQALNGSSGENKVAYGAQVFRSATCRRCRPTHKKNQIQAPILLESAWKRAKGRP